MSQLPRTHDLATIATRLDDLSAELAESPPLADLARRCHVHGCGRALRSDNASGYCRRHRKSIPRDPERHRANAARRARRYAARRAFGKTCSTCAGPIGHRNRSGLCYGCWHGAARRAEQPRVEAVRDTRNPHKTDYIARLVRTIGRTGEVA